MTLDTCDDRTAKAAFGNVSNPTDSYESFVNRSNHAQWVLWHLPTFVYKKPVCHPDNT